MTFAEWLANLLNGLLKLVNLGSELSISSRTEDKGETGSKSREDEPKEEDSKSEQKVSGTGIVTVPENISAHFWSTGSAAWGPGGVNNPGGQHFGTDFRAPNGSNVYAPYNIKIIKVGFYDDNTPENRARYGYYVIGTLDDGNEYYSGHLKDIQVKAGDAVKSGTVIGKTNNLNHTHVQLKIGGTVADFEEYRKKQ